MSEITSNSVQDVPEKYVNDPNKMPYEVFGVTIDQRDRDLLAQGKRTRLIKDMQSPEGNIFDGKIYLKENDKTGKLELMVDQKKQLLTIGDKFLNHKYTPQEKQELQEGNKIGPLTLNSEFKKIEGVFLSVDNQLNKVVVESQNEIGIFDKLGKYKLNDYDKNLLANNEMMPPRVYQGKDGKHFVARIKLTDDKKGIEYHNVKMLGNAQAQKLKKTLNVDHDISTVASTFQQKEYIKSEKINKGVDRNLPNKDKDQELVKKNKDSTKNQKLDQDNSNNKNLSQYELDNKHQKEIIDASNKVDIKRLKELKSINPPNQKTIDKIANNLNLSEPKITKVFNALNVDITKELKKTINQTRSKRFENLTSKLKQSNKSNSFNKSTIKTKSIESAIKPFNREL